MQSQSVGKLQLLNPALPPYLLLRVHSVLTIGPGTLRIPASTLPQLPGVSSITGGTHLDSLKHQLLQDPDWAAVSAARPVEMTFTPAEEIERFGKRRKLNDRDRQRLSVAYDHRPVPGLATLCRKGKGVSPTGVSLDQIRIQIDGRPAGLQSSDGQAESTNVPSSQSMLLDHEMSLISHSSCRESERSRRLSLQPSYSQPMLEKFLAGLHHSPVSQDMEPFDNVIPGIPETEKFRANSPPYRFQVNSTQKLTQTGCPPLIAAGLPLQPRHFPTDDQLLAERTQHTVALDYHALSCSPAKTLVASPVPSNTDTLPHHESFGWLSQPSHFNDSSSTHLGRVHAPNFLESIANQTSYLTSPIETFRDVSEVDSPSAPIKLFGQLVSNGDFENV